MSGFNTIILLGNLTDDAELSYAQSGTAIGKFTLAVNNRAGKKDETLFMPCTAFGGLADVVVKYTNKGSPLLVSGRLTQSNYTDKSGNKRTFYSVVVDKVQLLGGPKSKSPKSQNASQVDRPCNEASMPTSFAEEDF